MSAPAFIEAGGTYLPPSVCGDIWKVLLPDLQRRRNNGIRVRPELVQAAEVLRMAMQTHLMSVRADMEGPETRPIADMAPPLNQRPMLTTQELADRLDVTTRHARRIASEEGFEPAARNAWHPDDVAALVARRS